MRNIIFALLISLTATSCFVAAEPVTVSYAAPTGWVTLGERTVHGRVDRDIIHVGRANGRFHRLQFMVENSSLEMFDVRVVMGDGTAFHAPTRYVFHPGQASQVIDLPGGARVVRRVEFRYGNLPGGGRARVILMGS